MVVVSILDDSSTGVVDGVLIFVDVLVSSICDGRSSCFVDAVIDETHSQGVSVVVIFSVCLILVVVFVDVRVSRWNEDEEDHYPCSE